MVPVGGSVFSLSSCWDVRLPLDGWWLGRRVVYFWTLCMYSLDLDIFVLLLYDDEDE